MSTHQNSNGEIYTELIKQMMLDYVVHDMTQAQLTAKYKLTHKAVVTICITHKFREKRLQFQEKVLQKSLEKMATRQSFILSRLTNVLWKQVERIEHQQQRSDKLIDSNRMKEVLTAFALLSKEYRLDEGKSTDNSTHVIKVEFGSKVPIISENHVGKEPHETTSTVVESNPIQIPKVEEVQQEKEDEGIEIDDDVNVFGGLV